MTDAQAASIEAASILAGMVPAKPKGLIADRAEWATHLVYAEAALAAYRYAAGVCLTDAADAAGIDPGISIDVVRQEIYDARCISDLKEMCTPGFSWGGIVRTL